MATTQLPTADREAMLLALHRTFDPKQARSVEGMGVYLAVKALETLRLEFFACYPEARDPDYARAASFLSQVRANERKTIDAFKLYELLEDLFDPSRRPSRGDLQIEHTRRAKANAQRIDDLARGVTRAPRPESKDRPATLDVARPRPAPSAVPVAPVIKPARARYRVGFYWPEITRVDPGAPTQRIAELLLEDLANGGQVRFAMPPTPTAKRPSAAIYGREYIALVGPDKDQYDSFFCFAAYKHAGRVPSGCVVRAAELRERRLGEPATTRDTVAEIFAAVEAAPQPQPAWRPPPSAVTPPSPPVVVAEAPPMSARRVAEPMAPPPPVAATASRLAHHFARAPERLRQAIRGAIANPVTPSPDELAAFARKYEVTASTSRADLEASFFASHIASPLSRDDAHIERVIPELEDLLGLPPAPETTLAVWKAVHDDATPDAYFAELAKIAPALRLLAKVDDGAAWWASIADALRTMALHDLAVAWRPTAERLRDHSGSASEALVALADSLQASEQAAAPPSSERLLPSVGTAADDDAATDRIAALTHLWIRRRDGWSHARITSFKSELDELLKRVSSLDLDDLEGRITAHDALEQVNRFTSTWLASLPEPARAPGLRHEFTEALGSFMKLHELGLADDDLVALAEHAGAGAGDEASAADLLRRMTDVIHPERRRIWGHFPPWWWTSETGEGLVRRFLDRRTLTATADMCELLHGVDEVVLARLPTIPEPPEGTTPEEWLVEVCTQREAGPLADLLDQKAIDANQYATLKTWLSELAASTHKDDAPPISAALDEALRACTDFAGARKVLATMQEAQRFVRECIGADAGYRAVTGRFAKKLNERAPVTGPDEAAPAEKGVLRAPSFRTGEQQEPKPPLVWVGAEVHRGTVLVPLRLEFVGPIEGRVTIHLNVSSSAIRDALDPRAKQRVQGPDNLLELESFDLTAKDWTAKKGGGFATSVIVSVPLSKPEQGADLVLTFGARGACDAASDKLTWHIATVLEPGAQLNLRYQWDTTENATYAVEHPLGPQLEKGNILEALEDGKSVLVIAPRRFGKSSLAELLESELKGKATVARAVCLSSRGKTNHTDVWEKLGHGVVEQTHGVGLALQWDGGDPPLPVAQSFRNLRAWTRRDGRRGVVLILDEAHRLFAQDDPSQYAQRLKVLLSELKRTDDLAPLALCLLGLPTTLTASALGDLWGYVEHHTTRRLNEADVERVVKRITKGTIYLTRQAREHLASQCWNILVLQTMLKQLRSILEREKRAFALIDDVREAQRSLEEEVCVRRESQIAMYVGDIFNDAPTQDEWLPTDEYPFALAVAKAIEDGALTWETVRDKVTATFSEWGRHVAGLRSSHDVIEFDPRFVDERLQLLRTSGLLRVESTSVAFTSSITGAWLAGQARDTSFLDEKFAGVLQSLGRRMLSFPRDAKPLGEGAEASVYQFEVERERGGRAARKQRVMRLVELDNEERVARFLRGREVVEQLEDIRNGNSDVAGCLYVLHERAFTRHDGKLWGADVYDYIPGMTLAEMGPISRVATASIGARLAKLLRVLHERRVYHRDVAPRNIIQVDGTVFPVLIDFGLAVVGPSATRMQGDAYAPEVCAEHPNWTPAADAYGLAWTLRKVTADQKLRAWFDDFLKRDMVERTMSDLSDALDGWCNEAQAKERAEGLRRKIKEAVAKCDAHRFVTRMVDEPGRSDIIASFALDLYPTHEAKACAMAFFLNAVVESARGKSIADYNKGASPRLNSDDPRWHLVSLRNEHGHGQKRRLIVRSAEYILDAVKACAADVGLEALVPCASVLLGLEGKQG